MSDKKLEDMEKRLKKLEDDAKPKTVQIKEKRKPSEYNIFLAAEITKYKKADTTISHKDAWAKAIQAWKESKVPK